MTNEHDNLRIAIIVGSTRPGRRGADVAAWVQAAAVGRVDATYDVVDLADHPLPHLDEAMPPILGTYSEAHTQAWASTIATYDGFVVVTPEYNHSIPGVLKNAIDYLFAEWNHKVAGVVAYGAENGARAAEHLRQIFGELKVPVYGSTSACRSTSTSRTSNTSLRVLRWPAISTHCSTRSRFGATPCGTSGRTKKWSPDRSSSTEESSPGQILRAAATTLSLPDITLPTGLLCRLHTYPWRWPRQPGQRPVSLCSA